MLTGFFVIMQMWSFLLQPSYSQNTIEYYERYGDQLHYEVQPGDFFPTFLLWTDIDGVIDYDMKQYYDIYFETYTGGLNGA